MAVLQSGLPLSQGRAWRSSSQFPFEFHAGAATVGLSSGLQCSFRSCRFPRLMLPDAVPDSKTVQGELCWMSLSAESKRASLV